MPKTLYKILFTVLVFACAAAIYIFYIRGVVVVVRNGGPAAIHQIEISITGNKYTIDSLEPGKGRSIVLKSTGASGVAISFESQAGTCSIPSRGYFENSIIYSGTIFVELESTSCEPRVWDDKVSVGHVY